MYQRRTPARTHGAALPDQPDLALFVARLFERLGGSLEIDERGRRHVVRPDVSRYRGDALPQLAGARPWEQFRSPEEWSGAMKLAEYWLSRLGPADMEHVFTLLASVATEPNEQFDFRRMI